MLIAQQLYEGIDLGKEGTVGLITYMRTDSTRISDTAKQETYEYIRSTYGEEYARKGERKQKQDKMPKMPMKRFDRLRLSMSQNN